MLTQKLWSLVIVLGLSIMSLGVFAPSVEARDSDPLLVATPCPDSSNPYQSWTTIPYLVEGRPLYPGSSEIEKIIDDICVNTGHPLGIKVQGHRDGCGFGMFKPATSETCWHTVRRDCTDGYVGAGYTNLYAGLCVADFDHWLFHYAVIRADPHCRDPYLGPVTRTLGAGLVFGVPYCIHEGHDNYRGEDNGCLLGQTKVVNGSCVLTFRLYEGVEGYHSRRTTFGDVHVYGLNKRHDRWKVPLNTGGGSGASAGHTSTCTSSRCDLLDRLNDILNVMAFLVIPISSIVIVIGGVQYATAGGNPDAVKGARARIFNGALALVCFLLMWSFLKWLIPGGQLQ